MSTTRRAYTFFFLHRLVTSLTAHGIPGSKSILSSSGIFSLCRLLSPGYLEMLKVLKELPLQISPYRWRFRQRLLLAIGWHSARAHKLLARVQVIHTARWFLQAATLSDNHACEINNQGTCVHFLRIKYVGASLNRLCIPLSMPCIFI